MARTAAFDGIIISYLGNIDGRQPEHENRLKYLQAALKAGWHVCVDVVFHQGSFLLPFDGGFNPAPPSFFSNQRVWSQCYDADTLDALCNVGGHAFLSNEHGLTLTSAQFIWTMPGRELSPRSIAVFPEEQPGWLDQYEPAGLCSNQPARYI
jgi:hypothetical protein